jgi:hypothetical protein
MIGPEHLVFLIPIIAILGGISLGGFKEWLKFKSRQDKLGASTHELEETVSTLQAALESTEARNERLVERVQNIETIVTSADWDLLYEGAGPAALGEGNAAQREGEEASGADQTQRLARRLRG